MNKAADIYWDSNRPRRSAIKRAGTVSKAPARPNSDHSVSWWIVFGIAASIFVMLCVSINLRAYSALTVEVDENGRLETQAQSLRDENLALQEEIHLLKTDPKVIEREARRLGIGYEFDKVPVPEN